MNYRTLPLGVDIGTHRARIALAEGTRSGDVRVRAVVGRDLPSGAATSGGIAAPALVAAVLEEMIGELGTRERRCVGALGAPSAALRVLKFPRMSWAERLRAARFEAQRFAPWDVDAEPTVVRVHPVDRGEQVFAVGAVARSLLDARAGAFKSARLTVSAFDHDAFAFRRALAAYDAVVDIGSDRTTLHAFADPGPLSWTLAVGGNDITRGIAADLAVDETSAERRKRILGTAGAGAAARDVFVQHVCDLVDRARSRATVSRIALCGNGSRVPELARDLETATGAIVELPVTDLLAGGAYPDDVLRAAAPDWTLAVGLAAWGRG